MNHLTPSDLWPLPVYEGVRDQFRKEVIEAKRDRRVAVGPFLTFVFENRTTVKFQVQEILRIEHISDPALVAEEVEGFNEMLPSAGELSATLLIELTGSDAEVKAQLARLYGLRDHVWLEVGGARLKGELAPDREEPGRVSAVQYARFKVPEAQALLRGPALLVIDHPAYGHRAPLSEATRRSLAQDLS
ncbi:MAG TPA: DUF3501 family protein [Myxococcales bacterium]|nr:DUF3501 family protein [Myxococcales bacterium]